MSAQIDLSEKLLRALGRDLDRLADDITESGMILRDRARAQIRQEQPALDDLKKKQKQFADDSRPLLDRLRNATAAVDQLTAQQNAALAKLQPVYLWMPPAVDGVVTPENISGGIASAVATASAPASPVAPASPDQAQKQVDLARTYLDNKMPSQAAQLLRDVIQKYPDTPAAAQAQKLLADIQP